MPTVCEKDVQRSVLDIMGMMLDYGMFRTDVKHKY